MQPTPFVSWRNDIALFMGPRQRGFSAPDPDDLTAVEVRSHRLMEAHLDFYREHAPGFEQVDARAMAHRAGGPRRDRRFAEPCAQIPEYLDPLWLPGAAAPRRAHRLRPARRLRSELSLLPARDPAVLGDRAGRRRGGCARCGARRAPTCAGCSRDSGQTGNPGRGSQALERGPHGDESITVSSDQPVYEFRDTTVCGRWLLLRSATNGRLMAPGEFCRGNTDKLGQVEPKQCPSRGVVLQLSEI